MKIFFRKLVRHFNKAFISILRNFTLSLASISAITIMLIVTSIVVLFSFNVEKFTVDIENDLEIYVVLDGEITSDDTILIKRQIEAIENIESIVLSDKDTELELLGEEFEDLRDVVERYKGDENPLRDVFFIKVIDADLVGSTATQIEAIDGVDYLEYGAGLVEQLLGIFSKVNEVMYGVIIALILVSVFVISNTIKLTIHSRQDEVEIMHLAGASNRFIKSPFIIEGVILGLLGSLFPIGLTIYGYSYFYEYMGSNLILPIIKLVNPTPLVYEISVLLLGIGVLVGFWGSMTSMSKFLRR